MYFCYSTLLYKKCHYNSFKSQNIFKKRSAISTMDTELKFREVCHVNGRKS